MRRRIVQLPRLWPYFQAGIEPSPLAAALVAHRAPQVGEPRRRRRPPWAPRSPTRGASAAPATPRECRPRAAASGRSWVNPVPKRLRNSRSREVADQRRGLRPTYRSQPLPVPGAGVGACGWGRGLGSRLRRGAGLVLLRGRVLLRYVMALFLLLAPLARGHAEDGHRGPCRAMCGRCALSVTSESSACPGKSVEKRQIWTKRWVSERVLRAREGSGADLVGVAREPLRGVRRARRRTA